MGFTCGYFGECIDRIQQRIFAQCICDGYGIALVVWILVFGIIARLVRIADDLPIVSTLNRFLGLVFGAVSGLFIVWTILAILGGVQEYSWAAKIVEAARGNSVVMWLQSYSPIMIILQMMDFPVV